MGIPYQDVDAVAKCIPMEQNITLEKAMEISKDLKEMYTGSIKIKELIDMAKKVEGMPRHASTHAAGVVIASAPVSEFVPLQKNDDSIVTQNTMTVLESLGLLKMDFLGLRNLTVIRDCVNSVHRFEPNFDVDKIQIDDKAVYEMLSRGQTEGVFQFESNGMTQVLTRLSPETIEDLIAVISLYRPGPMESIPKYIKNRHSPEKITYKTPLLSTILDVTYGCIVYQEQVMQIFRTLAGYSYGRADLVRRAMAKKKADVMEKERHSFIYGDINSDGTVNCVGAVKNGVSPEIANEIFDEMSSFASYAFNKSHAAAYAYLAYQTAYLKYHYYKEYMAALMTNVMDSTTKIIEYIGDCEQNGIKLLNPDINESLEGFTPTGKGIRFGLLFIKNLGRGVINSIIVERTRGGIFTSLQDFCSRLFDKDINKRAMESLIKCGAFDNFELNRRQMLENYDKIFEGLGNFSRQNIEGQIDFFSNASKNAPMELVVQKVEEYPFAELLKMEKETIGMYISGHPLSQLSVLAKARKFQMIDTLQDYSDNDSVRILALLQTKKLHTTKSSAQMCFAEVEDCTGSVEVVVFPKTYEKYKNVLTDGAILEFIGHMSFKEKDDYKILVEEINTVDKFMTACKNMSLCIKISSTSKILDELVKIISENCGETKIRLYFSDLNKLTAVKGISGINLTEKFILELIKLVSAENFAFM
ncbi:MAG: DNA polymerase III subunit alpha [Oscillospiraceae bacterium]